VEINIWSEAQEGLHPFRISFGVNRGWTLTEDDNVFELNRIGNRSKHTGEQRFKPDIIDWLTGIEGEYKFKTRKGFFRENKKYNSVYTVCFSEEADASLFKLTWC